MGHYQDQLDLFHGVVHGLPQFAAFHSMARHQGPYRRTIKRAIVRFGGLGSSRANGEEMIGHKQTTRSHGLGRVHANCAGQLFEQKLPDATDR